MLKLRSLPLLAAVLIACPSPTGAQDSAKDASKPSAISKDLGTKAAQVGQSPDPKGASSQQATSAGELKPDQGDLDRIKARGTIRILIQGTGERFLPRRGMPALQDLERTEAFARHIGVKPRFVLVDSYEALIPKLLEGRGDLIASQFTITKQRAQKISFSRSVLAISEMLVAKKGAAKLPTKPEELDGAEVHVRKSSSYRETLEKLKKDKAPNLKIVFVPEHMDAEQIVYEVTSGKRALTVVDSHILEAIQTYNTDVQPLFPIAEGQRLAWGMRKNNPKLKAAVDGFVISKAMTTHQKKLASPDLEGIKKRGVLRVLTRNNPVTYFLYKGRQFGFDHELAKLIADDLGVRLDMVVPPSRAQLIPWLLQGKGDMIAASMTITDERKKKVQFTEPYFYVNEMVVKKKGAPKPTNLEELKAQKVHVRKSSNYYNTLRGLGVRSVVYAPEAIETEALIGQVADAKIPLTVADTHILDLELAYGTEVEPAFSLTKIDEAEMAKRRKGDMGAKRIAFAVRPQSKAFKAYLDKWVKKNYRGLKYNILKARYFKNKRKFARFKEKRSGKSGQISPYDALIKKYSIRYGLDWRLMAAQAYVESHFDPKAKSWVGALGLFQVMPRTGASMGFHNLQDPETGIHAGIKYMSRLISRFDPALPFKQRVRMALAAYNAGLGHVHDARRLAVQKGWDRDRWFQNVEKAMLLLAKPEYAKKARHGYCRGGEPVKYVSHIQSIYEAYLKVAPP